MFDKIQHIGYYTADLEAAVAWFNQGFGSENAGGGVVASSVQVPGGGSNAFLRFGQVEVELLQPADTSNLPQDGLVMHHVAYVVSRYPSAPSRSARPGGSSLWPMLPGPISWDSSCSTSTQLPPTTCCCT